MQDLFHKLLDYYNIDESDYSRLKRDVSLTNFNDGHTFKDIDKAADFVKAAINSNKKIMVYGDYDCDGVMSTSILVKMFKLLNVEVGYYIPSRYIDGYGLTLDRAKEIVDKGYNLLILIDNGITLVDVVSYLKDNNVDVLILDHHEAKEELPSANFIVHPEISEYGPVSVSAGYIAYTFSCYMLGYSDKYLATLAAISTVSDMMPLKEYNRDLLRVILEEYKIGEFYQLDLLNDNEKLTESSISMKIAPKINAVGRVVKDSSINRLVRYLTTDNKEEIKLLASWIKATNDKRKEVSDSLIRDLEKDESTKDTGVYIFDTDDGLVSILANQVLAKENKPVVCLATSSLDDSCYRGSIRTPKGYDALSLLNDLSPYIKEYGGHSYAAGLTIEKSKIDDFTKAFNDRCSRLEPPEIEYHVIDINITEIILENYYLIEEFSPFGQDWPSPSFRLRNIRTSSLNYSKNEEHIISNLSINTKIVGFGFPKRDVSTHQYVDLIGSFGLSTFRNVTSLEFRVSDVVPSK